MWNKLQVDLQCQHSFTKHKIGPMQHLCSPFFTDFHVEEIDLHRLNPETKLLTTHKYLGIAGHSISQASNENNRLPKQGWYPQHYKAFNKYLIQDGVHAFKQMSVGKRTSVDACTSARPAGYHGLDHKCVLETSLLSLNPPTFFAQHSARWRLDIQWRHHFQDLLHKIINHMLQEHN